MNDRELIKGLRNHEQRSRMSISLASWDARGILEVTHMPLQDDEAEHVELIISAMQRVLEKHRKHKKEAA
jgi:hypothetical protein